MLKPLSTKELGTLSVFVARRRQRARDNAHRMADLKQCIHEVENGLQVLQESPGPPPPSPADVFFRSPLLPQPGNQLGAAASLLSSSSSPRSGEQVAQMRGLLHHLRDYVDGPHARWSKGLSAPSVHGTPRTLPHPTRTRTRTRTRTLTLPQTRTRTQARIRTLG